MNIKLKFCCLSASGVPEALTCSSREKIPVKNDQIIQAGRMKGVVGIPFCTNILVDCPHMLYISCEVPVVKILHESEYKFTTDPDIFMKGVSQ